MHLPPRAESFPPAFHALGLARPASPVPCAPHTCICTAGHVHNTFTHARALQVQKARGNQNARKVQNGFTNQKTDNTAAQKRPKACGKRTDVYSASQKNDTRSCDCTQYSSPTLCSRSVSVLLFSQFRSSLSVRVPTEFARLRLMKLFSQTDE